MIKRKLLRVLRACCLSLSGIILGYIFVVSAASAAPVQVHLRSYLNGKYVQAGIGSNSYLDAVSDGVHRWETFKLIDLGENKVALQSTESGKYVRAGIGRYSYLGAVSEYIKGWETFNLVRLGDSRVALQSTVSGKYVRAGMTYMGAVSSGIGGWETFELIGTGLQCGYRKIYDCTGACVYQSTVDAWTGDTVCDDGTWGVNLSCGHFEYDGGDCVEKPGDRCSDSEIRDCNLNCVNESTAQYWNGDGYCDDGRYGIDLMCGKFTYDGGDCDDSSLY